MIKNTVGNVLDVKKRPVVIPHVCNDCGGFGSGVAYAILKKYPTVASAYKDWHKSCVSDQYHYLDTSLLSEEEVNLDETKEVMFRLGQIQLCKVQKGLFIANMLAQSTPGGEKIRGRHVEPIRYQSLEECMLRVGEFCDFYKHKFCKEIEIHAPWFGCGLAGGDKEKVKDMINDIWSDLDVTMYDFEG